MASMKAVKVAGAAAQAKEPAPKLSVTATKPSAARAASRRPSRSPGSRRRR